MYFDTKIGVTHWLGKLKIITFRYGMHDTNHFYERKKVIMRPTVKERN